LQKNLSTINKKGVPPLLRLQTCVTLTADESMICWRLKKEKGFIGHGRLEKLSLE